MLKSRSRGGCTSLSVPRALSTYSIHPVRLSMFMYAYPFSTADIVFFCIAIAWAWLEAPATVYARLYMVRPLISSVKLNLVLHRSPAKWEGATRASLRPLLTQKAHDSKKSYYHHLFHNFCPNTIKKETLKIWLKYRIQANTFPEVMFKNRRKQKKKWYYQTTGNASSESLWLRR